MESNESGLTVLDIELGAGALILVTVGGIATLHGIVAMVDVGLGADALVLVTVGGIAAIDGIVAMVDISLGADTLVLVAIGGVAAIDGIVAMVDVSLGADTLDLVAIGGVATIDGIVAMIDVNLGARTFVAVTIFGVLAVDAIGKCAASNTETQCGHQYQNLLVHHISTLLYRSLLLKQRLVIVESRTLWLEGSRHAGRIISRQQIYWQSPPNGLLTNPYTSQNQVNNLPEKCGLRNTSAFPILSLKNQRLNKHVTIPPVFQIHKTRLDR